MSKWGATDPEPGGEWTPWGIPRGMLRAAKTITDPVHGDIYINDLEQRLIDSPPMQRLRRVRQLGTTHLVYPGAVHTRFSHSLGTLRAAQDLLDAVNDNHRRRDHRPDLFDEWEAEEQEGVTNARARRFAEATVLARLGALLHDLCHVPIGHTIEDDLRLLDPHDKNPARFAKLWDQLDPEVLEVIQDYQPEWDGAPTFKEELEHLIVSKVDMPGATPWRSRYPFVEDIVGNTICADLIDYLQRDHYYTGLPMEIGHRFVDHFYVTPSTSTLHAERMVVRTTRDGQRRQDVITELEKYLRYRYELTERVLTHHAKTSADAMIGKLLEMWNDATWRDVAGETYPEVIAALDSDTNIDVVRQAVEDAQPPSARSRRGRGTTVVAEIDAEVKNRLEQQFLRRSDDGILEHLIERADQPNRGERWQGIGTLASAVLNRRLFKRAARADSDADRANVDALYEKFGTAAVRRRLEQDAAKYAEVKPGWKVVIWLPSPNMRMKVAKVLVDNDEGVAALADVTGDSGQIVEAHKRLWGITVYVAPDLMKEQPAQVATMLAFLRDRLDVAFHDSKGNLIEGLNDLALRLYSEQAQMTPAQTGDLREAMREPKLLAAATGSGTFEERLRQIDFEANRRGLVSRDKRPKVKRWADWSIVTGDE